MWKDPSLLIISVARSAAMQNGLHRPETMQDFQRVKTQLAPEEFHAAVKLWAGCYIAAQSVTTSAGQPSLSSNDWTIDRACEPGNNYTVPDNLRYHLLIQRFLARVDEAMSKRTCSPTGHPVQRESDGLMRLLECDLEDLERWIGKEAGEAHHIALAMVSMQLRSYYFFESSATEMRKQGLLRAYSAALNFISKIANEDAKNDFIKYVPNIYYQILNTAGMLVMKIINSSYARYVDIEEGKRSFNIVLSLLRRAILEDNDLRGRGGKILAQLWIIHHSRTIRRGQEPNLKVQSRLGASVLHDGLWAWREEFGGQTSPASRPSDSFSSLTPSLLPTSPAQSIQQRPPAASEFAILFSPAWIRC
ncbi:C6 zinc finger domain-containing protein [Trichoderma gamsii]|uniref:C6 zinc finger domain-containing protein n=1 Tax=Trichoderma gamsii TaxID=398673 RepID=A0A2P4Z8R3_9HYPO|nr:C6 zinc finger domain-containing protein [Trichoderma gamsii]PON20680.1 C6 zinc finger domain-containing protein [Trichoderma gamsii]